MGIKLTGTSQALEQQRTREEEARKTRFSQLAQIEDLKLRQADQAAQAEERKLQRERQAKLDADKAEQDQLTRDQAVLTRHRDLMSNYDRGGTVHELTPAEAAAYTRMYGRDVRAVRRDQHGFNFLGRRAVPEGQPLDPNADPWEARFLMNDSADMAEQVDLPRGFKALYSVVPGDQYWGDDVVDKVDGPKMLFGYLDQQGNYISRKDFHNPDKSEYAAVLADIRAKGIPESRQPGNVTERESIDRQEHYQVATELSWDISALWAKQKGGGVPPTVVNATVFDLPSARSELGRLNIAFRELEALRQTINDPDTPSRDKASAQKAYAKKGGDGQWKQLGDDRAALQTYVINEDQLEKLRPQWERKLKNSDNPAKTYMDLLEQNGLTEE